MAEANATRALLKNRYRHSDIFVGTAEQLCACGLVRPDQFPGQPGRGKVRATYFVSDGQPVPHGCSLFEQTYAVQRVSAERFSVDVQVADEEAQRREAIPTGKDCYSLPLDLPNTPVCQAPMVPTWTPTGFVFRRKREHDYVFEASIEHLEQSGIMEDQPLPSIDAQRAKSVRFRSSRFGWATVVQRTARTCFVVLNSPSEIRNADYEVLDYGGIVYHKGTKQQLQERRLGVGIGFPGEADRKTRKVKTLAPQTGCEVWIELLHPSDWFGEVPRYRVSVHRSEAEQEAIKTAKRKTEAERHRLERLKNMPATPDKFRNEVADTFLTLANIAKARMQSSDGYRFTSEVVGEFTDAITDAYWVIKNGATTGTSPQQKLQQVMRANAKADAPLQRFLESVAEPPPSDQAH